MRDIKVRAWDCEAEHMFYSDKPESDYFFEFIDGKLEGLAIRPPEPLSIDGPPLPWCESYPVEQLTDSCDKNAREIWEGDIMNFKADKGAPSGGYYAGTCGFHPENARVVEWDKDQWLVGGFRLSTQLRMYEVIGNIHENELLEKAE